jgi:hypothetical protein
MSKKDLDSTHARRDDARFEERGKMAKGGKIKDFIEWDKIIGKKVNGWEAEDNNGISILWENDKSKYTFYATPGWENDKKLPIQITSENGDNDIAMFSKNVNASYELNEYLKEVKKIIKIIGNKKYLDVSDFKNDFSKVIDNSHFAKGGKLVGKQKKLDVNKNGKLDAEDFKMLRGEKMAKGGQVKIGDKFYDKKFKQNLEILKEMDDSDAYYVKWDDGKEIPYSTKNINFFIEKKIWVKK